MRPRCGRVMLRYEAVWGAMLEDPVCGRPEGHTGVCRSVQALDRIREKQRVNWWPLLNEKRKAARAEAARLRAGGQTQAHSLQTQ